MRVVISGGTGLIGSALARRLRALGHEVVILTRGATGGPTGTAAGAAAGEGADGGGGLLRYLSWTAKPVAPGDPRPGWWEAVAGAGAVVNLAGESIAAGRWTPRQKERIRESRIQATRALVQAIEAAEPRPAVLVSGSAVGYYGPRGDEVIDEEAPPGDDFLSRVCVDWEAEARKAGAAGVRVVLVRTGLVLAREGGALPRLVLPFRLGAGGPLGHGRQWVPWIHLDDLVALLVFLIETPGLEGPFNGTAPEPVTSRDLARALGRVLRRPSWLPAPAFALRLALGEMADALLLSGQRAVPRRAREAGFRFRFPEVEPALQDLLDR
ncbi:TIGR01777 family oxidoreductase [Thermaerobacter subterraneus]|uniref:TIGR01777 family protein n=1 Tax=Thermaerobacter subterraneus DSM 13965 TaxID=867903 RepID=K6P3N8_9FIRM|nr:TIGR01777 family oxidoreductase [Thermaerobacter subterraneus]EKP95665.1 TIGR01777 family protein [Thermaerobacter subterraneus DSM 13965]